MVGRDDGIKLIHWVLLIFFTIRTYAEVEGEMPLRDVILSCGILCPE
jgi:hypothetical protein